MKWAAWLHGRWSNHYIDNLKPAEQWKNDDQFSSNEENDHEKDQENVAPDQDDVPSNTPVSAKPRNQWIGFYMITASVMKRLKRMQNFWIIFRKYLQMMRPTLSSNITSTWWSQLSMKQDAMRKQDLLKLSLINNEITKEEDNKL